MIYTATVLAEAGDLQPRVDRVFDELERTLASHELSITQQRLEMYAILRAIGRRIEDATPAVRPIAFLEEVSRELVARGGYVDRQPEEWLLGVNCGVTFGALPKRVLEWQDDTPARRRHRVRGIRLVIHKEDGSTWRMVLTGIAEGPVRPRPVTVTRRDPALEQWIRPFRLVAPLHHDSVVEIADVIWALLNADIEIPDPPPQEFISIKGVGETTAAVSSAVSALAAAVSAAAAWRASRQPPPAPPTPPPSAPAPPAPPPPPSAPAPPAPPSIDRRHAIQVARRRLRRGR
ncbi:hypothetical protein [Streptomyces sp. NPDC052042]|uniref:hypothetical protein n=1 Tax=Streptomyces sp. NPDC052042 TaxID=3365683 RepID=UPI0037D246E8